MTVDGKSVDVLFEPDGEVEAIEKEIEVEDLPRAVLKVARKKFRDARIEKVEEVTEEDDKVVYEITFKEKGEEAFEVVIAPNGKIIEDDEDDEKEKDGKQAKDDDEKKESKKAEKDDDEKADSKPKD